MIGERLQELRKDRCMSQYELAAMLNLSFHTVSSYERGRSEPSDEVKLRIARLFDVSLDYLLGLTDLERPPERDAARVLVLPPTFGDAEVREVRDYIDYLSYRQKKRGAET